MRLFLRYAVVGMPTEEKRIGLEAGCIKYWRKRDLIDVSRIRTNVDGLVVKLLLRKNFDISCLGNIH